MKNKLDCTVVNREILTDHLRHNDIARAEAAGDASVYHCTGEDGQSIAVAMPGDTGLIIRITKPPRTPVDRRRPRR
jgi:hypothetical protein